MARKKAEAGAKAPAVVQKEAAKPQEEQGVDLKVLAYRTLKSVLRAFPLGVVVAVLCDLLAKVLQDLDENKTGWDDESAAWLTENKGKLVALVGGTGAQAALGRRLKAESKEDAEW